MSAYVIVGYDITDAEGFEPYVPGVVPLLAKHNAEILVADFNPEALEGEKRSANIVLKFPSKQAALDWYNDPEYQPVRQIRFDTTSNGSAALTEEFVAPSE